MLKIPCINQIIKQKRKRLKLNQTEFANLINKSKVTVARYETGAIIPSDTLVTICERLNLDFYDLLAKQGEENKLNSVNFYKEIISFYKLDTKYKFIKNVSKELDTIYKITEILEFYYNVILKYRNNKDTLFSCELKNDKFFIKEKDKIDPVLVLTIEEAQKLIYELQSFFDFQLYKINSEKNNNQ